MDSRFGLRNVADPLNRLYESPNKADPARESPQANEAITHFQLASTDSALAPFQDYYRGLSSYAQGDPRYREVRNRTLSTITDRLAKQIADNQKASRVGAEITPYAAAAAMVSMMERMAAHHFDLEPRGVRRGELVETTARILHQTVTGRRN